MCYPKPGPRCSAHALARLARLREAKDNTSMFPDYDRYQRIKMLFEEAQKDYDSTPAGINEIARRLRRSPDDSRMKERLMVAVFTRKEALQAVHMKDVGDIEHTVDIQKKEQFKETQFLQEHSQFKDSIKNRQKMHLSQKQINRIIIESQSWIKKLDADEIEAVAWYTSDGSSETARYLIGSNVKGDGFDFDLSDDPNRQNTPANMKKNVEKLDSALNKANRKNPIRLFRGVAPETLTAFLNCGEDFLDGDKEEFKNKLNEFAGEGKTFSSPTFMSATKHFGVAASFTGIEKNTVMFEFLAKKAGPVSNASAWNAQEQEYVLPRNHDYKIHAIKEFQNDMDETTFIIQLTDVE